MYSIHYCIRFLALVLLVSTCNLAFAQIEKPFKNDWARDELKGRVKQIDHYTDKKLQKRITYSSSGFQTNYQVFSQDLPQKVSISYQSFYDAKGNLIKNVGGDFTAVNKYDEQGNLIENRNLWTGNKKTYSLQTFQFKGKQITRSKQTNFRYNSDEVDFINQIEYGYNEKSLLVEENETYTRGNEQILSKKVLYSYDELNRKRSKTTFNGRGDTTNRLEYDSLGRLTATRARFPNKIQVASPSDYNEYYKYDEKGNRIETANFSAAGVLLYKGVYKFYANGNCTNHQHFRGDQLTGENRYVYDGNGWLVEELNYTFGELTKRVLYKRDGHGNTISRVHFDGKGKQNLLLEYQIVYYD